MANIEWHKKFKLLDEQLKNVQELYSKIIINKSDEDIWQRTKSIVQDSRTWSFYTAEGIDEVKKMLEDVANLNLTYKYGYCCIWRYDESFTKSPIHIDEAAQHLGTVCIAAGLNSKFEIFFHDTETKEKLDSVIVEGNNIIVLNNSNFWHSVEGCGDLFILGAEKKENYFRKN